jgi:hypothetical protein
MGVTPAELVSSYYFSMGGGGGVKEVTIRPFICFSILKKNIQREKARTDTANELQRIRKVQLRPNKE